MTNFPKKKSTKDEQLERLESENKVLKQQLQWLKEQIERILKGLNPFSKDGLD